MTSARIGSRAAHPGCIPQTSATGAGRVISWRFRRVFASWFHVFADSRGVVAFCNVRSAFRFGERLPTGTFSPLFRPCLTSPIHPKQMAEVRQISCSSSSSSSSRCPVSSLCCPCLLPSVSACHPSLAHYFFAVTASVRSHLTVRSAYSSSGITFPLLHLQIGFLVILLLAFETGNC